MKLKNIASIILCGVSVFANATDVPITKGMPFLSARKALIKHGWKPNLTDHIDPSGTMRLLRDIGVNEVERCTEGFPYCEFNYKKNNVCLGITTTGEEVKDLIIDAWDLKYPEPY